MVTILDALYHGRDYARFYVLETIARVPYFGEYCSYLLISLSILIKPIKGLVV